MYGGRLPIPAVKVEDMSTTNREDGKTTIVVLASEPSYSASGIWSENGLFAPFAPLLQ